VSFTFDNVSRDKFSWISRVCLIFSHESIVVRSSQIAVGLAAPARHHLVAREETFTPRNVVACDSLMNCHGSIVNVGAREGANSEVLFGATPLRFQAAGAGWWGVRKKPEKTGKIRKKAGNHSRTKAEV